MADAVVLGVVAAIIAILLFPSQKMTADDYYYDRMNYGDPEYDDDHVEKNDSSLDSSDSGDSGGGSDD